LWHKAFSCLALSDFKRDKRGHKARHARIIFQKEMIPVDKLASVIGGSHSGDIVSTSNIDIEAVQRHEEEQLAKRIEEEAGEVKKRKCTPIEYLRLFNQVPRLDQVQVMKPKELTKEDAVRFIEAGCTRRR